MLEAVSGQAHNLEVGGSIPPTATNKLSVAVTGHTSGIGQAIFNYFAGNQVKGYSRSNGYDITLHSARSRILEDVKDFDIFVNNAYSNFDDSQLQMLSEICNLWRDTPRLVINISTRFTNSDSLYSKTKLELDKFCESFIHNDLYVLNLKPGIVDTPRVTNISGNKMIAEDILSAIEFCLLNKNKFKVHSLCFGK